MSYASIPAFQKYSFSEKDMNEAKKSIGRLLVQHTTVLITQGLYMYVCMVITCNSRVWINRVRLPILLVVSWTGKINIPLSPCVPENLISRDGFSRPAPRQPAHLHTQAESGPYLRDSSRVPRRCVYIACSEKSECSSIRSTFSSRPRAGSATV